MPFTSEEKTLKRHRSTLGWALTLGAMLVLLLPTMAGAGFATIDTDDGVVDPDWASVPTFQVSTNDTEIDDNYDIKETKLTSEADGSFWYFQMTLYGQLPLDNVTSLEARISCNGDAAFDHAEDKIILYYHADPATNDNAIECEGSDYPLCSSGELQGSDFGEESAVGDGSYSYEWKADLTDEGSIDWSTCDGTETVQFAVADEDGNTYDSTTASEFNAPSAVQLDQIRGTAAPSWELIALLSVVLMLGAVTLARRVTA